MKALVDAGTPVVTIVGKSWDLHVHEVLGVSLDENLRMIADSVAFCAAHVAEVIYDAEHFFDGFKQQPRLRPADPPGRGRRRRAAGSCSATPTAARLPEEIAAAVDAGRASRRRAARHPHPQRRRAWPSPTPWRPSARGVARCRGRSTASASAAATSTSAASSPTWRSSIQGYEVLSPGKLAHLTEVSRYVYETANMNFRPGQPFVGTSAFAHKGGMHVHGVRKNAAQLRAHRPGRRRQRAPGAGQRAVGQVEHRREARRVRPGAGPGLLTRGARPGAGPGERGLPVRGGRGVVRAAGREARRAHHAVVRAAGLPRQRRRPARTATPVDRGDGQAQGRRRRRAHRQRGGRPGQRPRRRLAQGPRSATSRGSSEMHLVDYKVRVINARAGTAARVRVVIESKDARRRLGHRRRLRERHRGELAGAGRRVRTQAGQAQSSCPGHRGRSGAGLRDQHRSLRMRGARMCAEKPRRRSDLR